MGAREPIDLPDNVAGASLRVGGSAIEVPPETAADYIESALYSLGNMFEMVGFTDAEDVLKDAWSALATIRANEAEALSPEQAWQLLIEMDDRNSPEEYPEMALITFDELTRFMEAAVRARGSAAATPANSEGTANHV